MFERKILSIGIPLSTHNLPAIEHSTYYLHFAQQHIILTALSEQNYEFKLAPCLLSLLQWEYDILGLLTLAVVR